MERGDPAAPERSDILRRWLALSDIFTQRDAALSAGAAAAYREALTDAGAGPKLPVSQALFDFMAEVARTARPTV
jgi:hypothetical protein